MPLTFANRQFRLGYLPALDGVRAFAMIGVLLAHAKVPYFGTAGGIGVTLFFVLSGFLITSLLIQENEKHGSIDLKMFYMRRILRLFPALVFLLICFLAYNYLRYSTISRDVYNAVLTAFFYFTNWVRAFNAENFMGELGHTWSVSIEEQFYLLWPPLLFIILRYMRSAYAAIALLVALTLSSYIHRCLLFTGGAEYFRVYNGLDTRADSLLLGCVLAFLVYSGVLSKASPWTGRIIRLLSVLGVAGLVIGIFLVERTKSLYTHEFFLLSALSMLFIAGLVLSPNPLLVRLLTNRFMTFTGKISYGMYLWHFPIFSELIDLDLSWRIVLPLGVSLTYIASSLSYYLVELRFLKMKSLFTARAAQAGNPGLAANYQTNTEGLDQ